MIGPACIAQRLMFAAAAAAAAAPKDSSGASEEDEDDEDFNAGEIGAMQMVAEEPSEDRTSQTSDSSPTAEKVAKAFLESVDKYILESNENREFSPKNGMSGVVVLGNGTIHRHYCENGLSNTNHNHIHTNGHQQAIGHLAINVCVHKLAARWSIDFFAKYCQLTFARFGGSASVIITLSQNKLQFRRVILQYL